MFVEGFTEVLFVEKLISEVAGAHRVVIEKRRISGGVLKPRQITVIEAAGPVDDQEFYILLYDCGGDHQVKPRIVEEHKSLTAAGYEKIIGLRDVRPHTAYNDIPLLERNLRAGIETTLTPVDFVLAVMEIEAWFLAECTHFPKIDPSITVAEIVAKLGFNPEVEDMALRLTPTEDLAKSYQIGGKTYAKPAQDTVACLDYSLLYLELTKKIPHLKNLVTSLDSFLTPLPS
ncbi:MAG: hypothetical protein B7X65_04215 [Polaromonas sp. 39-63-25]|nr:MAG: hypothetical protein B7Y09_09150 [Polaromonas sp. 24-63-21]OZA89684.1 MAG: hypothetical protein B7X65_04215 [Polaromonas sp. 39-63-25]